MSHKQELTERERIKCAYLHLICGVEQQHLCIAYEVNIGRVSEAITAIQLAASNPKEMRARMERAWTVLSRNYPTDDEAA